MLNEINQIAEGLGYNTIFVEAHEKKGLRSLLAPQFRKLLFALDRKRGLNASVKRGLAVLRAFIGAIKVSVGDYSFGLDIEPEKGTADSGDMELDLPDLFTVIGEAAKNCGTSVALLIDELQYFDEKELGALIMAIHKLQQKQLPFVLLGAGSPILPRLAGDSKSYAERLFNFPQIGALNPLDAAKALQQPAELTNVAFSTEALDEVYRLTEGYPYSFRSGDINAGTLQPQIPSTSKWYESRPQSYCLVSIRIFSAFDSIASSQVRKRCSGSWRNSVQGHTEWKI